MVSFPTYAYLWQISQIQIGGLQPCDDLTWNDADSTYSMVVNCYNPCNNKKQNPVKCTLQLHILNQSISTSYVRNYQV